MSGPAYEPVIGLEVHVQLDTATKLFSACPFDPGAGANQATDAYTWGLPGTLPALNEAAVERALRLALALGCEVARESGWDRKHYFYPDLPKGYQITQHGRPLARGGGLAVPDPDAGPWASRTIALERLHLEEDAGRVQSGGRVDYSRAGAPLLEIVTAPVIRSPAEAARVLRALRVLAIRLGVSGATMEDGSLRCDVNVSLRRAGERASGVRCEIKNLNSFKFTLQAAAAEIKRQEALLRSGASVEPVTLRFDPSRGLQVMRVKETSREYRWLPEPDLPPLVVDGAALAAARPVPGVLPEQTRARYRELGLAPAEALLLASEPVLGDYFDAALACTPGAAPERARRLCAWLCVELLGRVPALTRGVASRVEPRALAELVTMLEAGELTGPLAKRLLDLLVVEGGAPRELAAREGLVVSRDEAALAAAVAEVLRGHPRQVAEYRGGKKALWGYFFGRVVQALRGRVDPRRVHQHLDAALRAAQQGADPS